MARPPSDCSSGGTQLSKVGRMFIGEMRFESNDGEHAFELQVHLAIYRPNP